MSQHMCSVADAYADFQPNKAPPLSSVAVAAEGDIYTSEGPKPHTTPQALDKAGIAKVGSHSTESLLKTYSMYPTCLLFVV